MSRLGNPNYRNKGRRREDRAFERPNASKTAYQKGTQAYVLWGRKRNAKSDPSRSVQQQKIGGGKVRVAGGRVKRVDAFANRVPGKMNAFHRIKKRPDW